jgi:hypothetical protein
MRAQGEYYTLFTTQAKRYITPVDDYEENPENHHNRKPAGDNIFIQGE